MQNIHMVGKKQLAESGINFIACPSLAIPCLEKTYYPKFLWFPTMEALLAEIVKRKPLIVLDVLENTLSGDKVPTNMRGIPEVYCIRAWDTLPERDWSIIRSNICETDNHHFAFKWDISNSTDPYILASIKKKALVEHNANEYSKRELEEYMANAKTHNKRHPLLST